MNRRDTEETAPVPIVAVKWKSRRAAFDRTNVKVSQTACEIKCLLRSSDIQTIIEKSRNYFKIGFIQQEFALVGNINNFQCEFTDDMLRRLSTGAVLTLAEIPQECDSGDEAGASDPPAYAVSSGSYFTSV